MGFWVWVLQGAHTGVQATAQTVFAAGIAEHMEQGWQTDRHMHTTYAPGDWPVLTDM